MKTTWKRYKEIVPKRMKIINAILVTVVLFDLIVLAALPSWGKAAESLLFIICVYYIHLADYARCNLHSERFNIEIGTGVQEALEDAENALVTKNGDHLTVQAVEIIGGAK